MSDGTELACDQPGCGEKFPDRRRWGLHRYWRHKISRPGRKLRGNDIPVDLTGHPDMDVVATIKKRAADYRERAQKLDDMAEHLEGLLKEWKD